MFCPFVTSITIAIIVNKTRSCACKSLASESCFVFFNFQNKWVGRAVRNETFYWDGLTTILTYYTLYIISHRLFGLKGHLKNFQEKKIGCLHGKKYFTKNTKGYKKIERSIKYKICQTSKKANVSLKQTSGIYGYDVFET